MSTFFSKICKEIADLFFVSREDIIKYRIPVIGQKNSSYFTKTNNLSKEIEDHVLGKRQISALTSDMGNECVYCCLDYDLPKKIKEEYLLGEGKEEFEKQKIELRKIALADHVKYMAHGIPSVLEDSIGGFHLWFFFVKKEGLGRVYDFVSTIETRAGEFFPKQREIGEGGKGNGVRLPGYYHSIPLQTKTKREVSQFFDGETESWFPIRTEGDWSKFLQHCQKNKFSLEKIGKYPKKIVKVESPVVEKEQHIFSNERSKIVLQSAIETLKETPGIFDSFDSYKRLVLAMKDAANSFTDFGYEDFNEICKKSDNYNERLNNFHWNRATPNKISFKTLIYIAKSENPARFEDNLVRNGIKKEFFEERKEEENEDYVSAFGINPIEFSANEFKGLLDLQKPIRNLKPKRVFIFSAPTGVGKSKFYAKEVIEYVLQTQREATILTNSIESVDNVIGYLKHELRSLDWKIEITRNVSGGEDSEEQSVSQQKVGKIAVSTYAYLGRKGHTDETYKVAELLIKDRFVFCDEIQSLMDICRVNLPLSTRMKKTKTTWNSVNKCPQTCGSCIKAYLRKSPGQYKYQSFFPSFTETSKDKHTNKPIFLSLPDTMWDIQHYENDEGMYNMMLDESLNYDLPIVIEDLGEKEDEIIFEEYVSSLLSKMKFPQLSMVSPEIEGNFIRPSEINSENEDKVKFPVQGCQIPHLKGFDILPILQLLEAEKIVMCSATIPEETTKILDDIFVKKEGWEYEIAEISEIPVTYNATFMLTSTKLSTYTQAKVLKDIKHATLCVADKKNEARDLYAKTKRDRKEEVERFEAGEYIDQEAQRIRASDKDKFFQILITYLRATILTGVNRPDKQVMIIDCDGFYPQIICTKRDKEERRKEIVSKVQVLITQAVGRLLRSTKERIPGQTIQDDRKIVFLLHGLSFDVQIQKDLFHTIEIVQEVFVKENKPYESILGAIDEIMAGLPVSDYKKLDAENKCKKASQKGMRSLSEKQRQNVDKDEYEKMKLEQKKNKIFERIFKDAENFSGSWREFFIKKHISRHSKNAILTAEQIMKIRAKMEEKNN